MLWALSILLAVIVLPALYCLGAWITKHGYWDHIGSIGVALLLIGAVAAIVVGSVFLIHAGLVSLTSDPTQAPNITRENGR